MKINLKDNESKEIRTGCIIITKCNRMFLIIDNGMDNNCLCGQAQSGGYILVDLVSMMAWNTYNFISDIQSEFDIDRVIQPDNILLNEM